MTRLIDDALVEKTTDGLSEIHGNDCRERALEGVRSVAGFWLEEDGTPEDFSAFCFMHFAGTGDALQSLFARFESILEELQGSMHAISRRFSQAVDVECGPSLPMDGLLSSWSPSAHLADDFFGNKVALILHLNFPYLDLHRKIQEGDSWSRREWAMARLGDLFPVRIPAGVTARLAKAYSEAENYISSYNIFPAMLRDSDGWQKALFDPAKKLLMHWNMRDEIKSHYADPAGLRAQRLLYKAMESVVEGSIPRCFVDSVDYEWNPFDGKIVQAGSKAASLPLDAAGEGDGRYKNLLAIFQAERENDLWQSDNPTHSARKFNVDREIPEKEVEKLFGELFASPAFERCARFVKSKLERPLEPFDVWYRDFSSTGAKNEAELDALTRSRYPGAGAFQADIPRMLGVLGFDADTAAWLADRIEVDAARGSGHAMGCSMRSDKVHLRTRIPAGGMDYKGFNIACHELGHNVEQVFSLHGIDEYFLGGVPNTAFTEAFAFVFQARDMALLGSDMAAPKEAAPKEAALGVYWATCEIAGAALVDMAVWNWMYAHPECSPRDLREAVLQASRAVWNQYFSTAFGVRDALVLGTYSHMISSGLYLPDYPIGHIISYQIETAFARKAPGQLMGAMCRLGRLTPGQWMREATGSELSVVPLLEGALAELDAHRME